MDDFYLSNNPPLLSSIHLISKNGKRHRSGPVPHESFELLLTRTPDRPGPNITTELLPFEGYAFDQRISPGYGF